MHMQVSPSHWADDDADVILNDHNAALNNGAFMFRTTQGSCGYSCETPE
jgi:hypothetical protein